jgi:hypothetical protein
MKGNFNPISQDKVDSVTSEAMSFLESNLEERGDINVLSSGWKCLGLVRSGINDNNRADSDTILTKAKEDLEKLKGMQTVLNEAYASGIVSSFRNNLHVNPHIEVLSDCIKGLEQAIKNHDSDG